MDNHETSCLVMQAFVDGKYPIKDFAFWEQHMTDRDFVMSLLKIISSAYYSTDPTIGELLDHIETHIEKVIT
jgi:hypothetical protein